MTRIEPTQKDATVYVRNIGGIDETKVELAPGINVLAGRNATNRTSFLQAIMAVLGSTDIAMKGDADEAEVTLQIGQDVYQRQLNRRNDAISFSGDPYIGNPELADLFAFLLESNESRRAVTTGQDLRDVIMRPVDTERIKSEISQLESKKSNIVDDIAKIEEQKQSLPELESQRSRIRDQIEEKREDLANKEADIDGLDADIETKRDEKKELEEKLEQLRKARNDLQDVRYDIETERESIESLKRDRSALEEELDALSETSQEEIRDIDNELDHLRERRRRLDSEINSLQSTIRFNEEMLGDERSEVYEAMTDDGHTTNEILQNEVVCWTCGSEVPSDQIEETIADLREIRQEKLDEKRKITGDIDDRQADIDALRQQQERRAEYQRQLSQVESERERCEDRLEKLEERRSELEDEIRDLETEAEALESDQFDEILDLHRESNQLEYDLGRLETDLEDVESEIEAIESSLDELNDLEGEREQINAELTELRTRVETLEKEAVEAFNEHMNEVLNILGYENLERIWIERIQREVRDGRRKAIKTFFELHVVRSTPSGKTYEDTIDHLSESECEVTGLVFALAGYLVHEVYEDVPFMLLDSLEAIDAARIAELVEYFGEFADYLVVALLEEDANAVQGEYNRLESV